MGWEAYLTLSVIVLVFVGLVRNRPPDAVLVGGVVIVTLAGVITPKQAFAGFANTGMLTVAALYVVGAALRSTGALDSLGRIVLGGARTETGVIARLSISVTTISAFLNNTPIVAMFIPIISNWCKKNSISPSRLLLPLSYLSILGGTCTLIGTSTNLVVNGLMIDAVKANPDLEGALHPMGFFELGYVGLPYAVVGVIYLFFVGRWLLPTRRTFLERLSDSNRDFLINLEIQPDCPLVGQTVGGAALRKLPGLFLFEIRRNGEVISPVRPDHTLHAGDTLTFTGVVDTIVDLKRIPGLVPIADDGYETRADRQRERTLCEVVISATAACVGKTVRDAEFRAAYNAAVVAIHRAGERLSGKVGDIVLQPGDTLLVQAGPHFDRAHRNNPDFLLASGLQDYRPVRHDKAVTSLVLLAVLIVLMASGVIEVVTAAFVIAGMMVLTRCISVADARNSLDMQTLVTIGTAFGLATALEASGCVRGVTAAVVDVAGAYGPYALLAGVYIVTSIFTEVVTNNAAAALVFPFAVAMANELGVNPRPLVMAVAFAASASFVTPLGYQTNLMVFGPGGYRFSDFVRIGLPLNLILLTVATLLIPRVWPFAL